MSYVMAGMVAIVSLCACVVDDDSVERQQTNIERYLSSKGLEYVEEAGVYIHLAYRIPEHEADSWPAAQKGDSLVFRFAGYVFETAPSYLFYTNNRYLVEGDTILNNTYWSFEPQKVKLGDGSIIKGLETSLLNSKEGDSLLVFLTSELGYGDKSMGVVPENSALMYVLNVDRVIK